MMVDDDYIVTASEDKTVAVFDRRADKISKTLQVRGDSPTNLFLNRQCALPCINTDRKRKRKMPLRAGDDRGDDIAASQYE